MSAIVRRLSDIHSAIQDKNVKVLQIVDIEDPAHLAEIPKELIINFCLYSPDRHIAWANTLGNRQKVLCSVAPASRVGEFPETVHFDVISGLSDIHPSRYKVMQILCSEEPKIFVQPERVKHITFVGNCTSVCYASRYLACFEQIDQLTFQNTCCNSIPTEEFDRLGIKKIKILVADGVINLDNILKSISVKSLELIIDYNATLTYSPEIDNETITKIEQFGKFDDALFEMVKRNNRHEYQSRFDKVKPIICEKI